MLPEGIDVFEDGRGTKMTAKPQRRRRSLAPLSWLSGSVCHLYLILLLHTKHAPCACLGASASLRAVQRVGCD